MTQTDYMFYKTEYFGNVIPESDFWIYSEKAFRKIKLLTFGRLDNTDWLTEEQTQKAKMAICAMAEHIYYSNKLAISGINATGVDENGKGKAIASIKSGSESISYSVGGASTTSLEGQSVLLAMSEAKKEAIAHLAGIKYKDQGYSIIFAGVGY